MNERGATRKNRHDLRDRYIEADAAARISIQV